MKRILYLFYYLKDTDYKKFYEFLNFASIKTGKNKFSLLIDCVYCSMKYNISLMDYFYFKFYNSTNNIRNEYAGTGFMYEYQLKMNPLKVRDILENKILFLNHFSEFINRKHSTYSDMKRNDSEYNKILNPFSDYIVIKGSKGQTGKQVSVIETKGLTRDGLLKIMQDSNYDLVEEFVVQHSSLMELSPSGLNTIRLFTQLTNDNHVEFLGARLRITINSKVDNMAAGNPAAEVDLKTGKVIGSAYFSDIRKDPVSVHPITKVSIDGFEIPFWSQVIEMATMASLKAAGNKSIGWDIAITEKGPELIEGNHNWCKILWQIPVERGLKHHLLNYL